MLTKSQNTLYFREWGAARRNLIDTHGLAPKAADALRHDLHVRALGYDKPHVRMTNAEFDAILGVFRAISRSDDIEAQLRQIEQPITRVRRVVSALQYEMELSDAYIDGCCKNICHRLLDDCTVQDLTQKIIPALTYHRNRMERREDAAAATNADTNDNPF